MLATLNETTNQRTMIPARVGESCPLCGATAHASDGTTASRLSLLSCPHCRAFVIEKQLIDVIMNARAWNLRPVLRHVALLSRAAQSAAAHGTVLLITSTNWIRLALAEQSSTRMRVSPEECAVTRAT